MTKARLGWIAGMALFVAFACYVVLSATQLDMRSIAAANQRDEARQ